MRWAELDAEGSAVLRPLIFDEAEGRDCLRRLATGPAVLEVDEDGEASLLSGAAVRSRLWELETKRWYNSKMSARGKESRAGGFHLFDSYAN